MNNYNVIVPWATPGEDRAIEAEKKHIPLRNPWEAEKIADMMSLYRAMSDLTPRNPIGPLGSVVAAGNAWGAPQRALAGMLDAYRTGSGGYGQAAQQNAMAPMLGEEGIGMGQAMGLPQTKESDSWPAYIAKGGANLLADMAFDPMNAFGAKPAAGGLKFLRSLLGF